MVECSGVLGWDRHRVWSAWSSWKWSYASKPNQLCDFDEFELNPTWAISSKQDLSQTTDIANLLLETLNPIPKQFIEIVTDRIRR